MVIVTKRPADRHDGTTSRALPGRARPRSGASICPSGGLAAGVLASTQDERQAVQQ
jgi:hypothetical protein